MPPHSITKGGDDDRELSSGMKIDYVSDIAVIPYEDAWRLQLRLVSARQADTLQKNIILFLEHPPVLTMGRRGGLRHLIVSSAFLEKSGIALHQVERGGDITYHGPGQLVVYPIIRLIGSGLGVVDFVDRLEELMIRTVAEWGLQASRNSLNRGVWLGNKKLGSVGISIRRGITFHGLALNVTPDLAPFGWIHPCGLSGINMTSMAAQLTVSPTVSEVKSVMKRHWEQIFDVRLVEISPEKWLPER